jgi:hypothetical protein
MDDLHTLLRWQSTADLDGACEALRLRHQSIVGEAIGRLLATLATGNSTTVERVSQVRIGFDSLCSKALERILEAPETCYRVLRSPAASALQFLEDAITMERRRLGTPIAPLRGLWSATGDMYVPPQPAGSQSHVTNVGWLTDPAIPFQAATFDDIVIDFHSPSAARKLEQNNYRPDFAPPMPYSDHQVDCVTPKIVQALAGLSEVGGAPMIFVQRMLRTLHPRPELGDDRFNGSSNRIYPGRANLFNPHLQYINKSNIVNSLIHEAVHTFLYLTEQREMPAQDTHVLYYDLIESPWSKRSIHLLSYIHASFVWYALFHFWKLPEAKIVFDGHVRDHYLEFVQKGYAGGQMLDRLERFRPHIRPDLMDQLSSLQETMLAQ